MDTPSNFIPHEHPLLDVEECFDLLGNFSGFLVLTCWCSVSVWGNNLGLQAAKPVLFSAAGEGL